MNRRNLILLSVLFGMISAVPCLASEEFPDTQSKEDQDRAYKIVMVSQEAMRGSPMLDQYQQSLCAKNRYMKPPRNAAEQKALDDAAASGGLEGCTLWMGRRDPQFKGRTAPAMAMQLDSGRTKQERIISCRQSALQVMAEQRALGDQCPGAKPAKP